MYIAARIFICIAAMALPLSRQCFMCTILLRVCTIRFRVCAIRKNIVLLRSLCAPVSYLRFASNDRQRGNRRQYSPLPVAENRVRRFLIYALLRTIVNVVTGGRQRVSGSDG